MADRPKRWWLIGEDSPRAPPFAPIRSPGPPAAEPKDGRGWRRRSGLAERYSCSSLQEKIFARASSIR